MFIFSSYPSINIAFRRLSVFQVGFPISREKKIYVSFVFISGQGSILQQRLTYFAALALPHFTILSTWSGSQVSKSTDFTVAGDIKKGISKWIQNIEIVQDQLYFIPLLIWVPIDRWTPEHRMQTKIPIFQDAHRGSSSNSWTLSFQKGERGLIPRDWRIANLFSYNQHRIYCQAVVTMTLISLCFVHWQPCQPYVNVECSSRIQFSGL